MHLYINDVDYPLLNDDVTRYVIHCKFLCMDTNIHFSNWIISLFKISLIAILVLVIYILDSSIMKYCCKKRGQIDKYKNMLLFRHNLTTNKCWNSLCDFSNRTSSLSFNNHNILVHFVLSCISHIYYCSYVILSSFVKMYF